MTEWIDSFVESYLNAMGAMDLGALEPFSQTELHPLYAKEWCGRLLELEAALGSRGMVPQESAKLFSNLSHLHAQLYFALFDSKCAGLDRKTRLAVAEFFNQNLLSLAAEDPYGLYCNKLMGPDEASEKISAIPWQSGAVQVSKALGRFYASALHYTHGLYSDIYADYATENYGPYDASAKFGDGAIMVERVFHDLKPQELWPASVKSPAKRLRTYSIYRGVEFSCDMISCHSAFKGDIHSGLVAYAIECDGRFVGLGEAEAMTDEFTGLAVSQWKALLSHGFEQVKLTGLRQRCYSFKALFDAVGMDWHPTKETEAAVAGKQFVGEEYWRLPQSAAGRREFWRKLLDPRLDFYPQGAVRA